MQDTRNILNGRYEIVRRAGTGGMSTVYQGLDSLLGRRVAIKILHENLTSDEEFLRRFQKEAHSAANLSHPNIVTVHDIGQDGRRYYIVMEYVEGQTLKDFIRQYYQRFDRPISVEQALDIAIKICAGVGYAHRANLVHCDIKSQNVLVSLDNQVKVTDFGIARALSETTIQESEIIWGTPQYFSPEQAAGESPTPASDVYSIGVILFEMLTGRLPFDADSHTALAVKHMRQTPPPASQYNPAIPRQIDQIVAKVLSKEPSGRYRTADQLGQVLVSYRKRSAEQTGIAAVELAGLTKITEMKTEINYIQPEMTRKAPEKTQLAPPKTPDPAVYSSSLKPDIVYSPLDEAPDMDWTVVTLGVIALISLLGLIPLWYIVFLRYTG